MPEPTVCPLFSAGGQEKVFAARQSGQDKDNAKKALQVTAALSAESY